MKLLLPRQRFKDKVYIARQEFDLIMVTDAGCGVNHAVLNGSVIFMAGKLSARLEHFRDEIQALHGHARDSSRILEYSYGLFLTASIVTS